MTMIERLRGIDADTLSPDEMIELRAGATALQAQYQASGYEVPEWLRDRTAMLDRELSAKRADAIQKRLKELDAQELGLETAQEKRDRIKAERERLQQALNPAQPVGA